jgi:hypothetical protein
MTGFCWMAYDSNHAATRTKDGRLGRHGSPSRLEPPANLRKAERALFSELVEATDPRHFRQTDLPLLISFVQATLLARSAAHNPDKVDIWEKAVRVQASLATRLRLSPQSRTDPKTIGRQQLHVGPRPWET